MSHHLENRALRIGEGAVSCWLRSRTRATSPPRQSHAIRDARSRRQPRGGARSRTRRPSTAATSAARRLTRTIPLAGEWSVIVVGPHFSGALVAQDLGDTCREADRRFTFATTYRRDLVIAAARTLLERIAPVIAVEALPDRLSA